MTLVDRVNGLMIERGLNRAEVAKGAGIPYTTLVAIFESGGDNTKLSTLRKLSAFFGLTIDELTSEEAETIAAHHDGEDWTEEELDVIRNFKKLIKSQRPRE